MTSRADISQAALRISDYVRRTPVLSIGDEALGCQYPVVCKLELLQHTGSFKPRGVFNHLLMAGRLDSGVIAASGGNHGAAVAFAARALSLRSEIFVPTTTPEAKLSRIQAYGARIFRSGATYAEALDASRVRQAETGALEVHGYDDAAVIAGQGTVGRELEQQAPELTDVLVATGGGGLIGGIAAWYRGSARVICVEPESCPTLHDALRADKPVPVAVGGLAADSLGASQAGALTFPIARRHAAAAVLVADAAIRAAQWWLWDRARIVVEPGGATALAALLSRAFVPPPGARVGVVFCGGNTNPAEMFA